MSAIDTRSPDAAVADAAAGAAVPVPIPAAAPANRGERAEGRGLRWWRRWLRLGRRHWRRVPSPLTLRILAVNVLALALLVGGLLYLGRYQDRLIQAELDALRTEARIFAGAIGEGAVEVSPEEESRLAPELARQMVRRLVETTETRTRLFDTGGNLLADSRLLIGPGGVVQIEELPPLPPGNPLGRLALMLYNRVFNGFPDRSRLPVYQEWPVQTAERYAEVQHALAGEVGAHVWRHGERGLVLTVAVPVQRFKQVLGAVLLSRSGAEIDAAIRSVRLDILKVFAMALGITVLLSLYLAGTIARPIRRLARAADQVRHGHGRRPAIPDFTARGDEIGDLSAALRDMTAALWARMDAIERFAADVAHEIKNPLTSLRSAVETAVRVTDPAQQRRLMQIIVDDVARLDRLITDISAASRLDAELSRAVSEPVDLGGLLRMLADIHATVAEPDDGGGGGGSGGGSGGGGAPAPPPVRVAVELPDGEDLTVPGLEGRLVQVFQNLLANALSFSPPGGAVTLAARRLDGAVEVTVSDDGPGIPDGKLEAIFERFYSERPPGEKFGTHSGLGLSISKQIAEAHGGTLVARNRTREDGTVAGAEFTVRLPRG